MSAPSLDCRRCPRLVTLRRRIRAEHADYHAAPVQAFGSIDPWLLIVGLAPGLHGANATGRPFTGDASGALLFRTLYDHGFSSAPVSCGPGDGLVLYDCRITNAVKCLPPGNRPVAAEIRACNAFLAGEIAGAPMILALGRLAHESIVRALGLGLRAHDFAHAAEHRLGDGRLLLDCYHCSRYNVNIGRLTPAMFDAVFARLRLRYDRQGLPAAGSGPS